MSENLEPQNQKKDRPFWELVKFAILAIIIVIPIRTFIAQPFIVSGSSMIPTFTDGEYLIVDEISYRFREPARGDVIIFHYPKDPKKYFIKRIIGLPNEILEIDQDKVKIATAANPDGVILTEPYINAATKSIVKKTLGPGEYFVMGDNRNASSDSRLWGSLPRDLIVGRAVMRLFPINSISILPGDYKNF